MSPVAIIVGLVAVAGLGWLGWISVQSLRQAALMRGAHDTVTREMQDTPVALYGDVHVQRGLGGAGHSCLWRRTVVEERSGWGRRRHWRTVADDADIADFVLMVHGADVHIDELPTEVQGAASDRGYDGGGGFFGFGGPDTRHTEYWLPVVPQLTIVGRLENRGGRWILKRDATIGLLFSAEAPTVAARTELTKGLAGFAGIIAGIVFVVWFLTSNNLR